MHKFPERRKIYFTKNYEFSWHCQILQLFSHQKDLPLGCLTHTAHQAHQPSKVMWQFVPVPCIHVSCNDVFNPPWHLQRLRNKMGALLDVLQDTFGWRKACGIFTNFKVALPLFRHTLLAGQCRVHFHFWPLDFELLLEVRQFINPVHRMKSEWFV